jgi:hypothetical protein
MKSRIRKLPSDASVLLLLPTLPRELLAEDDAEGRILCSSDLKCYKSASFYSEVTVCVAVQYITLLSTSLINSYILSSNYTGSVKQFLLSKIPASTQTSICFLK